MRKIVRIKNKILSLHAKTVTMSVRFTLEKRTNVYGESPIRLSWSFGGQRYQTTIGFSVMKTYWDEKNCLVKPESHNQKRQTADDINFYIKRIGQVVTGIEQHLAGNEKALKKTIMKNAISDACGLDVALPKDIVECYLNGLSKTTSNPYSLYYHDNHSDKNYRYICDAKHLFPAGGKFKILQELFGRGECIAVPVSEFESKKVEGAMYPTIHFETPKYEEVFGMKS